MLLPLTPSLQQAAAARDTIVALTMPAERTLFDLTSGALQIVALLAGTVALIAVAVSALAVRRAVTALQGTVDRLSADAKPLLQQATRAAEEARDVVKLVRAETEKLAEASSAVSARVREVTDAAADRIDEVNALLDVLQEEVEGTALSAAATVRGLRVGAVALGAALGGRRRATIDEADDPFDDEAPDEAFDDEDADDAREDEGLGDEEDEEERPYFADGPDDSEEAPRVGTDEEDEEDDEGPPPARPRRRRRD
jgi:hypothetical protein